jgi:hypothetical protein
VPFYANLPTATTSSVEINEYPIELVLKVNVIFPLPEPRVTYDVGIF